MLQIFHIFLGDTLSINRVIMWMTVRLSLGLLLLMVLNCLSLHMVALIFSFCARKN